jgi:hypothetical protein
MEDKFQVEKREKEFVFSKAIKAGKRIYYIDVKRTNNSENLFMTLTESKKVVVENDPTQPQMSFVKQKMTIYSEDLENFATAFNEVVDFINQASKGKSTRKFERKESLPANDISENKNYISKLTNADFDDISFDI